MTNPTPYLEQSPEEKRQTIGNAFEAAGTATLGSFAAPRPSNSVGTFGGRLAKTADHAALSKAEEMATRGVPREQIWSDTGWFKGVDGKWRFEIDDSAADFTGKKSGPLSGVMTHPELFNAYPDMGGIDFYTKTGTGGNYSPAMFNRFEEKTIPESITVGTEQQTAQPVSVALHEVQHGLQNRESFARGANESGITSTDDYEFRRMLPQNKAREFWGLSPAIKREILYGVHAGEVEARAVQKRMDLTADQRRARPPWLDYDVPENQQIVRFANGDINANAKTGAAVPLATEAAKHQNALMQNPIRAYHGSPHDFDKFDLSKIGTGEGAQAYGHGLYFAENEGVAKSYRTTLGSWDREVKSRVSDQLGITLSDEGASNFQRAAMAADGDPARAAKLIQMRVPETRNIPSDRVAAVAKQLHEVDRPGRLYEVSINAHPDDFLDWDKPLSQQSEKVRAAAQKILEGRESQQGPVKPDALAERLRAAGMGNFADKLGKRKPIDLATRTASELTDKLDTVKLRNAGIPGIRYLDQGSRTAGEGSRNYVVFDDALVEILRKYGLLGTLGAGAAASAYGAPPAEAAPTNALMRPNR